MRIDTKLRALQQVSQGNLFTFEAEPILNDQYMKIQNWDDVCVALRVLRDVDWLGENSQSQLLDEYLENRAGGDAIELPMGDFRTLEEAAQRYNEGLSILINALRSHAVSPSTETIWVEIKSASDPSELASIVSEVERALNIAGQADASFRFAGVAQGSDWLGFLPNTELTGAALNYSINLAATVSVELLKMSGPALKAVVGLIIDKENRDTEPTQEEIDEQIGVVKDATAEVMIEDGVRVFSDHLDEAGFPPEVRHQVGASIKATTKIIQEMAESKRAVFEPSESGKSIIVEIHGNNNQITIQNFPDIAHRREALPTAESD